MNTRDMLRRRQCEEWTWSIEKVDGEWLVLEAAPGLGQFPNALQAMREADFRNAKKYNVVFITKTGHEVREQHRTIDDAKLRASALGWHIDNLSLILDSAGVK